MFQFLIGKMKTLSPYIWKLHAGMFQFLIGKMKTFSQELLDFYSAQSFNSS